MVQLPEPCKEDSEAFQAGFCNIAEIGKERIRRAAKKIKKDLQDKIVTLSQKVAKLEEKNKKTKCRSEPRNNRRNRKTKSRNSYPKGASQKFGFRFSVVPAYFFQF